MASACKVCEVWKSEALDRLLLLGHGPPFVAARWGLPRHLVKRHRDKCLAEDTRRRSDAMKWINHKSKRGAHEEHAEH